MVPDIAGGVSEDKVMDKCFELVFAFDEVITTGGYRESITLPMIKTHVVRRNSKVSISCPKRPGVNV